MSYVGENFTGTDPTEVELYAFDFLTVLATGEVILTATFAVSVISGTDPLASTRKVGITIINGTVVAQMVGPLLAGCTYLLQATVTTSLGQTLDLYSHVPCQALS